MVCFIEGIETFKCLQVDDLGVVYIYYTVTDEYMKEKSLIYKNRTFEVDLTNSDQPMFISYASEDNFLDVIEFE